MKPTKLKITRLTYSFFSLLPISESLAIRGQRLNDTPTQRQGVFYGPDVLKDVQVRESATRLEVMFSDPFHEGFTLGLGELKTLNLSVRNVGKTDVGDIFFVTNPDDALCVMEESTCKSSFNQRPTKLISFVLLDFEHKPGIPQVQVVSSANSMAPRGPFPLAVNQLQLSSQIRPGETLNVPVILSGQFLGTHSVSLLVLYREVIAKPPSSISFAHFHITG